MVKSSNFIQHAFDTFKYYIRRLLPFFCIYIIIETIERIFLVVLEFDRLDKNFLELLKIFKVGFVVNFIEFLWVAIPVSLYLLFLPRKKHGSRLDHFFSLIIFAIFSAAILFEEIAEVVFWDEFTARFNFIAVDYLIYTTEVIGNIWESYPMVWILTGIFIFTVISTRLMSNKLIKKNVTAPSLRYRFFFIIVLGAVNIIIYLNSNFSSVSISPNYLNNEIAKNGAYTLFSAFMNNELDYETFYIRHDQKEVSEIVRNKFSGQPGVTLTEDTASISRTISNSSNTDLANVIITIMESQGDEYMDFHRENDPITPNLTKLSNEGLYFPNTYATGTRTVRGLEAITLSIPPLPGMSIVRRKGNENLHSIGKIFLDKGYKNKFIYGGYGYFDNMNYFFAENGFEIVDRVTMQSDEITFANIWGVCDEDLYRKAIKEADKNYAENEPFLQVLLTTSNHRPFTFPANTIDIEKYKNRKAGAHYADYAAGKFLEQAKTKPWFDNTIFIFIADHGPGGAGRKELEIEKHHIPFIIYAPSLIKAEKIDKMISQIDVLPTLLGILGFDYESRFYGLDALRPGFESRYFISNYQKIAYGRDNKDSIMTILQPVRELVQYNGDNKIVPDEKTQYLIDEAIAYYQHASGWRTHLRQNLLTE